MASLAPTDGIDGTAVSEPDEMEQSLEEELESIQNEQSIQVIPDPPPVAPSSQEVPPVAEPEQHEETAAANVLDDPQQGDFYGFTPMELESCRAKRGKRRALLTEEDLEWETLYDTWSSTEVTFGSPEPKPGKIRVKRPSDLIMSPRSEAATAAPPPTAAEVPSKTPKPKKKLTPAKKPKVQPALPPPPEPPKDPMEDFEKEVVAQQVMPPAPPPQRSHLPVSPLASPKLPAVAHAAAATPSPSRNRLLTMPLYPSTSPMAAPSSGKRAWKPGAQFFKPLAAGWKREVVYGRNPDNGEYTDKPTAIIYHAPKGPGVKTRKFLNMDELRTFIAKSDLSLQNFSFRKDPMSAPKDQEICHADDEEVEIFPPDAPSLGSPQHPTTPVANKPFSHQPQVNDAKAATKNPLLASASTGSVGKLKVKMFSKMKEKNTIEAQRRASSDAASSGDHSPPPLSIDEARNDPMQSGKQSSLPNVVPLQVPSLPRPAGQRPTSASAGPGRPPFKKKKARAALRPNNMTSRVNCSIHCAKTSGPPELSCHSCNKLFHPVCVGLMEGPDYSGFDFYCADCPPPPGTECVEMPPPLDEMMDMEVDSPARGQQQPTLPPIPAVTAAKQHPRAPSPKAPFTAKSRKRNPFGATKRASMEAVAAAAGAATTAATAAANHAKQAQAAAAAVAEKPLPLRPIESQAVVNIAGTKFLVVPHPKVTNNSNNAQAKKGGKGGRDRTNEGNNLLPLLLQPFESGTGKEGPMPTFEVEQTPDGKMILVPTGNEENGPSAKGLFPGLSKKAEKNPPVTTPAPKAPERPPFNVNSLHDSYNALLCVFKHLSKQDLAKAGTVCRFWRQVSLDPCLWKNVSLKNVKVTSWAGLSRTLNSVVDGRVNLDFKKVVHASPERWEETWTQVEGVAAALNNVSRIEVPKITASSLNQIVSKMAESPISRLTRVSAGSIVTSKDPADMSVFASVRGLEELKLKSSGGSLAVTNLDLGLDTMLNNSRDSLVKLSLVSLKDLGVKHMDVIANFPNLEVLELGDCGQMQAGGSNLFGKLIPLSGRLKHLRLERANIGSDIGTLEHFEKLISLELIDVDLKGGFGQGFIKLRKLNKLMLIPSYRDEVATINSEIVDSALSMAGLNFLVIGLTNEWLESMRALVGAKDPATAGGATSGKSRDNFPILVNGAIELFSLTKLFKTLSAALPSAQVKILKMPKSATTKQFIANR